MALKIPPLVLVLISALLMWVLGLASPGTRFEIPGAGVVAALLAIAGIAVCAFGVISFRRAKTTVNPLNPESASSLVVVGIYHYSRNPMYLGFVLILLAWGITLSNLLALLIVPVFVVYMNRFQITPEERALESVFGQEYLAYKQAVRRWL